MAPYGRLSYIYRWKTITGKILDCRKNIEVDMSITMKRNNLASGCPDEWLIIVIHPDIRTYIDIMLRLGLFDVDCQLMLINLVSILTITLGVTPLMKGLVRFIHIEGCNADRNASTFLLPKNANHTLEESIDQNRMEDMTL